MHGVAWLLSTENTLPNSETWTRTRLVDIPSYDIWHARLGHVSSGYIKKMQTLGLINNIDYLSLSKCQICATSKQTKMRCENEPSSYFETISSSNALLWKKAIKTELKSILKNLTSELVDLPSGAKLIS